MVGREVVFIRKSDVQVFEDRFPRVSVRYFTREHLNICIRVRWFGNRIMERGFLNRIAQSGGHFCRSWNEGVANVRASYSRYDAPSIDVPRT
jgi:hypothetical protein